MSDTNLVMHTPLDCQYYMPAEWSNHERCWMAWPTRQIDWPSVGIGWPDLGLVEQSYASVANAIAGFEPVTMVVDPSDLERAIALCDSNVEVLELPVNDSWMRDTGPSFLKHKQTGEIAGTAWRFNCWGGFYPHYLEDAQIAGRILDRLGLPTYRSSLTMEGGAFHVDGEGTLVTTESAALNPNRNWGLDKKQAEIEFCRATGAEKVIWLPGDLDSETPDMTDGHVDGVMCFVEPGVVLVERDVSNDGVNARLEKENRRVLELATDARGRKLEIIDLEVDHSEIGADYDLFCDSYVNFYLPNGGLIMPSYGVASDQIVQAFLAKIFSDREVVMVDINAIAPGGGGIHCITQQQPARG
jgi:agmatine deiminase